MGLRPTSIFFLVFLVIGACFFIILYQGFIPIGKGETAVDWASAGVAGWSVMIFIRCFFAKEAPFIRNPNNKEILKSGIFMCFGLLFSAVSIVIFNSVSFERYIENALEELEDRQYENALQNYKQAIDLGDSSFQFNFRKDSSKKLINARDATIMAIECFELNKKIEKIDPRADLQIYQNIRITLSRNSISIAGESANKESLFFLKKDDNPCA